MQRYAVIAALLLAAPCVATAQSASPPAEIADSFFRTLQSGDALKAYQQVWSGTYMDKKQADVENVAAQNAVALKSYGKILGWELVSERVISPSLVERLYLVRTEVLPMFYKIQFYRPNTKWIVGNMYFTDNYKNVQ